MSRNKRNFSGTLLSRPDLRRIAELIEPGSRVLDLGCGNGEFLHYLAAAKQVKGLGIEINPKKIDQCVHLGIPVIHGDLNEPLDYLEDQSFDCVLLTRTLQELAHPEHLLREVTRVGRRGLVGFINFGHIRNRMQFCFQGRMPRSRILPHAWYNTPNIHLGTLRDFRELCAELDIEILHAVPTGPARGFFARLLPNFLARAAVFEIRKRPAAGTNSPADQRKTEQKPN